ncbi:MAG: hypothetical protein ACK53L_14010, partial [Pirellulaceae bacterium]
MTAPAFLGRRRRRGGTQFNPLQLFANGEAGAWYDPGDLTAEKVAWRRNLLTWSEQFDNAAWTKSAGGVGLAPVVTANAGVAPDGTTTADRVQFDCANTGSSSNRSQLVQSPAMAIGRPFVGSLYVKAFNAGNIGNTLRFAIDGIGVALVTLTADWQRVANTGTASAATANYIVETRGTVTQQTADVLLWGGQFEPGTTASAYQRITD